MSVYVKISNPKIVSGSYNAGLEQSIIYIGKRYGELANIEGLDDRQYLKSGIAYIAKKFGRFRKKAIKYMLYPKNIKNSPYTQWCFHKQIYAKAYALIANLLYNAVPKDMDYVCELILSLYRENNFYSGDEPIWYSDALIYRQKKMLLLNRNDVTDGEKSGIILRDVETYDKCIPAYWGRDL